MKKLLSCIFLMVGMLGGSVLAQEGLSQVGSLVDISSMQDRGTVSRYDLSYFLNLADCTACTQPENALLDAYNETWREDLRADPSIYIDDIVLGQELYQGKEYSYCLASVIDNEWMSGYPRATSPFCPGRFCGANTLSVGDFVETVISFLGETAWQGTNVVWNDVATWTQDAGVFLDTESLELLGNNLDKCGEDTCEIVSTNEFDLYLRYCRHNLAACDMQATDALGQGDYGVAYANILLDLGVLRQEDIQDLGRYDALPSTVFLNVFDILLTRSGCNWSQDRDNDDVQNEFDNCVNVYNPLQADDDDDDIGNVCDADIDGDGITNAVGVIDDAGNILFELVQKSNDSCVVTVNPDQRDTDGDGIGNACDTDEKSLAGNRQDILLPEQRRTSGSLNIQVNKYQGNPPLEVAFEPISDRAIQEIEWYFGDGAWSTKMSPPYVFDAGGIWTTRAVATFEDGSKAVAKQTIHVIQTQDDALAFEGYADVLQGVSPLEVALQHRYEGPIDTVIWTIGEEQHTIAAGEDYGHVFSGRGLYDVLAQGFVNNALVAESHLSIDVTSPTEGTGRGAYIQATPLVVRVSEQVNIETIYEGFTPEMISSITREIDGELQDETGLVLTKSFLETGVQKVRQRIDFVDEYPPLFQEMNFFVAPALEGGKDILATRLKLSKELLQVGEEVAATVVLEGGTEQQIRSLQRTAGELTRSGTTLEEIFTFATSGAKRIAAHVITTDNELFILEATINVLGNELCLTNDGVCDLDQDTIIDMCDTDIDGDGVENLLGILIGENEECRFSRSVIDLDRLQEEIQLIKKGDDLDNCPFVENGTQEDADQDALGDACDPAYDPEEENLDTDGDGIPDEDDACPEIPENINGKEDKDGCPEIGAGDAGGGGGGSGSAGGSSAGGAGTDPFVKPDECIQCPCAKADYASELMPGDRVKAVLVDPSEEIIYSHSAPRVIRQVE